MSLGKWEQLEARVAKLELLNERRSQLAFEGVPVPGTGLTLRGRGDGFADVEDDQSKAVGYSMHSTFRADILANPVLVTAVKQTMHECGLRSVQALHGFIGLSAAELREGPSCAAEPSRARMTLGPVPVPGAPRFYLQREEGLLQPTATLLSGLEHEPTFQEAYCPPNRDAILAIKVAARSLGVERIRCVNAVLGVNTIKKDEP